MDSFIDIVFGILILALVIVVLYAIFTFKTTKEKEYEKKLKESLKDEFIIDPETGVKLTLEEAESGKWFTHDNEFRTIPRDELNKIPFERERQIETALNYLRGSRFFTKAILNIAEEKILDATKILSGYQDWSYYDVYKFPKGYIFLPTVDDYVTETRLMLWLKINNIRGHYLFREKTSSEKFFDKIRNDDEIKLENYECFTVKKSHNSISIINILKKIINKNGLEIEINNDDLFIKTLKLVSVDDVKKMEAIIDDFK